MNDGNTIVIELKNLPTFYYGQCYLIELMNANQWNEKMAVIYFGYRFEISYLNEYIKQVRLYLFSSEMVYICIEMGNVE